jgi:hypothetical protein
MVHENQTIRTVCNFLRKKSKKDSRVSQLVVFAVQQNLKLS